MKTPHSTHLSPPQIPQNLPCSVTLQPGPEDTGKVGLGEREGRFWREEGVCEAIGLAAPALTTALSLAGLWRGL